MKITTDCTDEETEKSQKIMNNESKFHPHEEYGAKPASYVLENETYLIVGAALDVYHRLGIGFAEPVYQEALEIEFGLRDISFEREKWLQISYKGRELKKQYKADFLCFGQIIVELKAQAALSTTDWSQVINYLKASNLRVGLLFDFGHPRFLEKKRLIVWSVSFQCPHSVFSVVLEREHRVHRRRHGINTGRKY